MPRCHLYTDADDDAAADDDDPLKMMLLVMMLAAVIVKSYPGVKSRAMDRCFCWVSTARGSNQVF